MFPKLDIVSSLGGNEVVIVSSLGGNEVVIVSSLGGNEVVIVSSGGDAPSSPLPVCVVAGQERAVLSSPRHRPEERGPSSRRPEPPSSPHHPLQVATPVASEDLTTTSGSSHTFAMYYRIRPN